MTEKEWGGMEGDGRTEKEPSGKRERRREGGKGVGGPEGGPEYPGRVRSQQ